MDRILAKILHVVAFLSAVIGGFLLFQAMLSAASGGTPQVGTVVFAIGFAVIPYCLAGSLHRYISISKPSATDDA